MATVTFKVNTNKRQFTKQATVTDYYNMHGHPDYENLDNNHRSEDYNILQELKKDVAFNETITSFEMVKMGE